MMSEAGVGFRRRAASSGLTTVREYVKYRATSLLRKPAALDRRAWERGVIQELYGCAGLTGAPFWRSHMVGLE